MLQIENEYGSWPVSKQDKNYINYLVDAWRAQNITIPLYTADGSTLLNTNIHPVGAAIGLDGSCTEEDFENAVKLDPKVPVFVSEIYPGWLRHWDETDW